MSVMSKAALAVAASFIVPIPSLASQRTFVASYGNDANACTFVNPCRSFTTAHGLTDDGGEIVALDAAGYGVVAITKSIAITANPGFYAGITAASGNAVTIATPNVKVVLRGLNLNGTGGVNGIAMTDGASLSIENCVFANFSASGISVEAPSAKVKIVGSVFRANFDGVWISNGLADISGSKALGNARAGFLAANNVVDAVVNMAVSDSVATGGQVGVGAIAGGGTTSIRVTAIRVTATMNSLSGFRVQSIVGGTPILSVGDSMATGNAVGLEQVAGGAPTLESLGNNIVRNNGTATSGTITPFSGS